MNKKTDREKELEEFRKLLQKIPDSEFDGHTDFAKLTPRQKLEWLSQLIYFKYLASQAKKKKQTKL